MISNRNLSPGALSRRQFVVLASATGLGLFTESGRLSADSRMHQSDPVASGPWGHIDRLDKGIWGVVSTPLESDDWTTLCNGGILAGEDRTLVVESFARPSGARLVAEQARELSGRWPTDVLVTHYHGDHANGLEGLVDGDSKPVVWMTATTRELIREADGQREQALDPLREEMLETARLIDPDKTLEMDLGGLDLEIHPRRGHTASDVTVEIQEPSVVFCGDLVWNRMFPNYRDTLPSALSESVRSLQRAKPTTYVSGHGPVATDNDVDRFIQLIDAVEDAARQAIEKGSSAAEAAAELRLPGPLDDWHRFRDNYFEIAIGSWYKEQGLDPAG